MKKYNIKLNQDELMKIIEALNIKVETLQDYITEVICERDEFDEKEFNEITEKIQTILKLNEKLTQIKREE